MLATSHPLVDASPAAMDWLLLLALILFAVGFVLSAMQKTVMTTLTFAGLVAVSAALMFLT